jgi:DNA ligase (NAD+)
MSFIYSLGFREIRERKLCKSEAEVEEFYSELITKRDSLEVLLDGMVIKLDSIDEQNSLGFRVKTPRFAVAYKFPAIEKSSKIVDVTFQVGRTGVITPVAILEPVEIEGVEVKRATLNNFYDIRKKDIKLNDRVTIIRSGDVIPKIIKPLLSFRENPKEIEAPTLCPTCQTPLLIEEKLIKCQNLSCADRVVSSLIYFASKNCLNIRGLGKSVAKALYESSLVKSIEDIYSLERKQLLKLDGFKDKKVDNLLEAIENSKKPKLSKFINALSIEHIGEVASEKIAKQDSILDISKEQLLSIDGFGEEMSESYIEFMAINRERVEHLLKILEPTREERIDGKYNSKRVVITGTLSKSRDEIKEYLQSMGATVTNSVSKTTDFLICGENAGSKLEKAKELGVIILREEEI